MGKKNYFKIIVIIIFQIMTIQTWATQKTISGLPPTGFLHINIKKVCVTQDSIKPFSSSAYVPELALSFGVFKADFNLKSKQLDSFASNYIESKLFFSNYKSDVKTNATTQEYTFTNFTFTVPVADFEFALRDLLTLQPISSFTSAIAPIGLINAALSDKDPQNIIRTLGFYIGFKNQKSLVSFNGKNSNLTTNLYQPYDHEFRYYERLWPLFAILHEDHGIYFSIAANKNYGDYVQEQYNTDIECTNKNFINYSVLLEEI